MLPSGIFAAGYDWVLRPCERAGFSDRRRGLLARARGDVLEIGAGTGLNLPHYTRAVTRLVLTEPDHAMRRRLAGKVERLGIAHEIVGCGAESLPFPDATFDAVVSTLVFCSVTDPPAALAEVRRVLRPGGELLFLEHVRAEDGRLARWQDRLDWFQSWIGRGCHCDRRTVDAIRAAGFDLVELEHGIIPRMPPHLRPLAQGVARA